MKHNLLTIGGLALLLVACTPPPSRGLINITASGVPAGQTATISIKKADNTQADSLSLGNEAKTSKELDVGTYSLSADDLTAGGFTFKPTFTPASASVEAGKTTEVALSYAASDGRLTVNISGLPTLTDGKVTVAKQGGGFSQELTATTTLSGLVPGVYTITPANVSAGGTTYSAASSTVEVTAGTNTPAAVNYAAGTGNLQIGVTGLPAGANASVNVAGPNGYTNNLSTGQTISNLLPGSYIVTAGNVVSGGLTYTATISGSPATVVAGATANAGVNYVASTGKLTVTASGLPTGANPNISVTGPGGFNQTVTTAPTTFDNLATGSYTVSANNVVANTFTYAGNISGSPASVTAGATVNVSVTYAATNGSLQIILADLPGTAIASVTLTGPAPSTATKKVAFAPGETNKTELLALGSYNITSTALAGSIVEAFYTNSSALGATVTAGAVAPITVNHIKQVGTGQLFVSGTTANQSEGVFSFSDATLVAGSGNASNTINIGSIDQPLGLVFDKAGNLYVISQLNKTVSRISVANLSSSSPTPNLVISTTTTGDLSGPEYAAFDSQGNLWVTSYNNSRLVKFSVAQLALSGPQDLTPAAVVTTSSSFLNNVGGIAIDKDNNVYVSAFNANLVTRIPASELTGSGAITLNAGQVTTLSSFSGPSGLAFDASNRLWVVNYAANNVVRVKGDFSGTDATITDSRPGPTTMTKPNHLAFDKQGKLWVSTDNGVGGSGGTITQGELLRFDPAQSAQAPSPVFNITGAGTGLAFNLHPTGLPLNGRP